MSWIGSAATDKFDPEPSDPATAGRITAIERIIGFRNVLIHGCDLLDDAGVWNHIHHHLPRLLAEAEALPAEPEDEGE